jgi:hypothetical protein
MEVALRSDGFLQVRPALPEGSDYQYIYRAANGIRWSHDHRALQPHELGSSSPAFWFERMVEAVKSEYGDELVLTNATAWKDVPAELQAEIQG